MIVTQRWVILAGCAFTATLALGQGGFNGPGIYEITNLKSGLVLDIDQRDRVTLVQSPPRGTPGQQWDISPAAPGYYLIRNVATRRALEFTQDRNSAAVVAQTTEGNPNQSWQIQAGKDGNAMLISRFGKALDVPDGSNRDGVRLQIYDRNGDSNQRFTLRRVGGGAPDNRDGDRRGDDRGRPDRTGRFYDDKDRMWKLAGDGVCFYRDRDFRGDAVCIRAGEDMPDVAREGGDVFRSVKFFGRVRQVQIFERAAFRGGDMRINNDTSDLARVPWLVPGGAPGVHIGSFRVN
jgi:hypothetical protein